MVAPPIPLSSPSIHHLMSKITDLEALLEERPDDPFIIYALAREYEKLPAGSLQALLTYEHLVTQHPDYVATYYHYAKLLYIGGNRNEAIRLVNLGIAAGLKAGDLHAVSELKGLLAGWTDESEED